MYVQATSNPIVPTYTTVITADDDRQIVMSATATVMDTGRTIMLDEEEEKLTAIDKGTTPQTPKDDDDKAAVTDNEIDSIRPKKLASGATLRSTSQVQATENSQPHVNCVWRA